MGHRPSRVRCPGRHRARSRCSLRGCWRHVLVDADGVRWIVGGLGRSEAAVRAILGLTLRSDFGPLTLDAGGSGSYSGSNPGTVSGSVTGNVDKGTWNQPGNPPKSGTFARGRRRPTPGALRRRPTAPDHHCQEPSASRTRADQARFSCLGARRHVAPARRPRPSREPGCRSRDRCLQDRVRTLGQRDQPGGLAATHPGVARRAQSRDCGQMITGATPVPIRGTS